MTIKVNIENGVLEWSLNDAIKKMPEGLRPNPFNEATAKTKFIELAIYHYIVYLERNELFAMEVKEIEDEVRLRAEPSTSSRKAAWNNTWTPF